MTGSVVECVFEEDVAPRRPILLTYLPADAGGLCAAAHYHAAADRNPWCTDSCVKFFNSFSACNGPAGGC